MLLKTPKGNFFLENNFRDAFKEEAFLEKYLEEIFDKDLYIVGDISDGILRLKGFDTDPKSESHYSNLSKYLETSTVIGCPYFVLKRIRTQEEFEKLEKNQNKIKTDESGFVINNITKENFDKESLVLQSSGKGNPSIVLDSLKFNSIPKGELPQDLKDNKEVKETKPVEESYVSSSPDFDPSKKENRNKGQNRNQNRDNNHNKEKDNNFNNNNQKNFKKKNKGFRFKGNNNSK